MGKAPSFPLYTADIIRDMSPLGALARGVWCTFLLHAHTAEPRGEITKTAGAWATMCGESIEGFEEALVELILNGTGDVEINGKPCNADVTVTLEGDSALHVTPGNGLKLSRNDYVTMVNRRMVRERKSKQNQRDRVRKHREKKAGKRESNASETRRNPVPSSSLSLDIDSYPPTPQNDPAPFVEESGCAAFEARFMPSYKTVLDAWRDERRTAGLTFVADPQTKDGASRLAVMIEREEVPVENVRKAMANLLSDEEARERYTLKGLANNLSIWIDGGKRNGKAGGGKHRRGGRTDQGECLERGAKAFEGL